MFADFSAEQLRLLAFGSQKLPFPKGSTVFHDGQVTDGGYAISKGSLNLVSYVDGQERIVGTFTTGDLIGEIAILTRNNRIGSAIAVEDCELMKISRSTMHRILSEYPELAASLHQKIAERVATFTRNLEQVERTLQS